MVADTDDLDDFIEGIKKLLDDDGIFFFETFYFYLQVKNFVWDFTYHEHYSYFLVQPLKKYFENKGLEIINIEPNLTKGGSMRCVLKLKGGKYPVNKSVKNHIDEEIKSGFYNGDLLKNILIKLIFTKKILKKKYLELLRMVQKISGYGASATSTTLIYHYEMGDMLDFLYDDFKVKHNLYSPGYHIKVLPSEYIYKNNPEYIIILTWRYHDKIIQKNKKFLIVVENLFYHCLNLK